MCASSVALGASVDRTGKVISGTNYSTIIASIPTNPLLAARSGLSNCGALTSQVLQGSGALNATTNEALTACQQLDPLFLLNVYKDCNFSIAADPALADNSLLTKVITSGVVPSGVIKAGQDAAAGVNKAVDGAKGAVQTVGDGARNVAQTVADGGRKAVEAVQGAFGELGRVFGG
jgi:phage-related tail protein